MRRAQGALARRGLVGAQTVVHRPATVLELADVARESKSLYVFGSDRLARERHGSSVTTLGLRQILSLSSADQVVAVQAGVEMAFLQESLAEKGQCLPFANWTGDAYDCRLPGTIGGLISENLSSHLQPAMGSWRDWVLGMTVVLADGTAAKSGSHAVKSVAGYDVHKLFIGSRGTLCVIAEVILRTSPLASLPSISMHRIQRQHQILDETQMRLMKRAKQIFDPTHKLNPGEMGIF
jgi:glycolate oxidase FAD binding subunit